MDDAIREPLGILSAALALPGVRIHPASGILELVSFSLQFALGGVGAQRTPCGGAARGSTD